MCRVQKRSWAAGFTMMELLVTLAVVGVISVVASMNMSRQTPLYRLNSATKQMAWNLRALRMQAIKQHHTVTITFTNNHVYTIWTDTNDNTQVDEGEVQTIDINSKYKNFTFTSTNNPVFNTTGTVTNSASITLTNSKNSKTISMNASGNIKIN